MFGPRKIWQPSCPRPTERSRKAIWIKPMDWKLLLFPIWAVIRWINGSSVDGRTTRLSDQISADRKRRQQIRLGYKPGCEFLYLGMKLCIWVWSFISGCEVLQLGMKFCDLVWRFVSWYEVLYWGIKYLHTYCLRVWGFVYWYEIMYPGLKFNLWIWS
jgi:hypothetical protein